MSRPHRLSLVVLVLLVSVGVPATGQSSTSAQITAVSYSAEGSFDMDGEHLGLWAGEPHEFTATIETGDGFDGELCLVSDDGARTVGCRDRTLPANATTDVAVDIDRWEGEMGTTTLSLALRSNGTTVATSEPQPVEFMRQDGDLDGDGLPNAREIAAGSDPRVRDTDGDGLDDSAEVRTYETSPVNTDTDGDGLSDSAEVKGYDTNPTAGDSDGDGLPDERELAVGTNPTAADTDGDGLEDTLEVNTYETNATSADTDGDGLDDGAEIQRYETNPTEPDTDDDGLDDALEVNTYGTDPTTVDTDGDGLGDGAEVNEYGTDPTVTDSDGDGLVDGVEVNQYGTDPTAADTDDDGLADGAEVDQYGTDPTDADTDGDGIGDRAAVDPYPWGHFPLPVILLGAIATLMSVAGGLLYRSNRGPAISLPRPFQKQDDGESTIAAAADDPAGAETVEGLPVEFLSNEERIHRLLADNDGRMRQVEIVEETGWSKSKVSRVLSGMADDGAVVKVDVGKGNVITLPERVPPGAESPFEQ